MMICNEGRHCPLCDNSCESYIEVEPVRYGRWVEYENEADRGYHYCSECKHQAFNYDEGDCNVEILSDYCPNCGCRMDGGDEDG